MTTYASGKTLILFDIDGTLLYSDKVDSQCFANSYQATFDRKFPTIDWTKFTEVTDHVIFRTAFHDHFGRYPSEAEREIFEEHYLGALTQVRGENPSEFREVPGAAAFWRRLEADDRYLTGVATGGWQKPAAVKLAHIGLPAAPPYGSYANNHFSRVDILQRAIDLASAEHQVNRVIYFGDAVWDVTTTRKMALPLIGVRYRGDHDKLQVHGHDRIITNYDEPEDVHRMIEEIG